MAYYPAQNDQPFNDYQGLLELQEVNGTDPQHTLHSLHLRNLPLPTASDCVLTIWHYQTNNVLLTVVILSLGCCMPMLLSFDFVTVISFFSLVTSTVVVYHLHNKRRYIYMQRLLQVWDHRDKWVIS